MTQGSDERGIDSTRRARRWRTLLGRRGLVLQGVLGGAVMAALAAAVLHGSAKPSPGAVEALIGGAAAAIFAIAVWLHRVARRLRELTRDAHRLEREELDGKHDFAALEGSAELSRLSLGLRRLVRSARNKLQALHVQNVALGRELGQRSHELDTLEELSIGLAAKSEVQDLVDEALGALAHTLEYSSASVWSRIAQERGAPVVLLGCRSPEASDEQLRRLVGSRLSRSSVSVYETLERERRTIVENQPRTGLLSWLWTLILDDATSSALHRQTRSWIALPLLARHEVIGVLRVDHHEADYFDATRSRLLAAVAAQTALALRHAQALLAEREMAVQTERNRIARELHDAVSQTLFAANVIAGSMVRTAGQGQAEQARMLERLNRAALAEMRLLMFELRPEALDQTPLADLLLHRVDALVCRGDIEVATSLARGEVLPPDTKMHVYRIAQEALSNASRHSGATHVHVEWRSEPDGGMSLRVGDDGCGFDPALSKPGHFGLANMRERAAEIGAVLVIDSAPGRGCELVLSLAPAQVGTPAPAAAPRIAAPTSLTS